MSRALLPISAFIIAKNEADRIGKTIASVIDLVEEVLVVDSGSTDETVAIAKAMGAKVLFNPWPGYGPQKRFAEDQCSHDWLLNLDADEVLTYELQEEMRVLASSGQLFQRPCWRLYIADTYAHEDKPARFAFRYNQVRFYDRRKLRFEASPVHDSVLPSNEMQVGQLQGLVEHRSIKSVTFMIDKLNDYSSAQVEDLLARGKSLPRYRLLTEFPLNFLKAYFLRRYVTQGWWGVVLATNFAYYRFMRVAKFHEARLMAKNKGIKNKI